jgi:hypothetical protein
MAVVEYTPMPRAVIATVLAMFIAGCVTPVVLENPITSERVNCTLEAERMARGVPNPGPGTDVPRARANPAFTSFDLEQQCMGNLLNAGYVCLSGCRAPAPR